MDYECVIKAARRIKMQKMMCISRFLSRAKKRRVGLRLNHESVYSSAFFTRANGMSHYDISVL